MPEIKVVDVSTLPVEGKDFKGISLPFYKGKKYGVMSLDAYQAHIVSIVGGKMEQDAGLALKFVGFTDEVNINTTVVNTNPNAEVYFSNAKKVFVFKDGNTFYLRHKTLFGIYNTGSTVRQDKIFLNDVVLYSYDKVQGGIMRISDVEIVQDFGDSTSALMSQDAITRKFAEAQTEETQDINAVNTRIDTLSSKVDADKADTTSKLATKVDKTTYQSDKELANTEIAGIKSTHQTDKQATDTEIANLKSTKVDKELGKGLSTNDYTQEEKAKLAGIEEGAQKNVLPLQEMGDSTTDTISQHTITKEFSNNYNKISAIASKVGTIVELPYKITEGKWVRKTNGNIESASTCKIAEYNVRGLEGSTLIVTIHQKNNVVLESASIVSFWDNDIFVKSEKDSESIADYNLAINIPNNGTNKIILSMGLDADFSVTTSDNSIFTEENEFNEFKDSTNARLSDNTLLEGVVTQGQWVRASNGKIEIARGLKTISYNITKYLGDTIHIEINQPQDIIGPTASIVSFWNKGVFVKSEKTSENVANYNLDIQLPSAGIDEVILSLDKDGVYSCAVPNELAPVAKKEFNKYTFDNDKYVGEIIPIEGVVKEGHWVRASNGKIENSQYFKTIDFDISNIQGRFAQIVIRQKENILREAGSMVSFWKDDTYINNAKLSDSIANYDLLMSIPEGNANKMVLSMGIDADYNVEYKEKGVFATKEYVDSSCLQNKQIYNNPLPYRTSADSMDILFVGSSYGVDSIAGLADIAQNLNLNVHTGDIYLSGGGFKELLDKAIKNEPITYYYNNSEDGSKVQSSKTIKDAIIEKNWDVIILQDSATIAMHTKPNRFDSDFSELLAFVKKWSTNPRVSIAINCVWDSPVGEIGMQSRYNVINDLSRQSGINLIIPTGRAIELLQKSSLNDGHYLTRDNLHLNVGVARYTAACTLFQMLVAPVLGVSVVNNTFEGSIDYQGSINEIFPRISVTNENRSICIDCVLSAIANRY